MLTFIITVHLMTRHSPTVKTGKHRCQRDLCETSEKHIALYTRRRVHKTKR